MEDENSSSRTGGGERKGVGQPRQVEVRRRVAREPPRRGVADQEEDVVVAATGAEAMAGPIFGLLGIGMRRSEERRVGKECRN